MLTFTSCIEVVQLCQGKQEEAETKGKNYKRVRGAEQDEVCAKMDIQNTAGCDCSTQRSFLELLETRQTAMSSNQIMRASNHMPHRCRSAASAHSCHTHLPVDSGSIGDAKSTQGWLILSRPVLLDFLHQTCSSTYFGYL